MSEFREIRNLMKVIHGGRLLGLWSLFLCVLSPETATFAMLISLAAVSDINYRVVPNTICLAIAGLGIVNMILSGAEIKWALLNVMAAFILLLLVKVFFRDGIGMGDLKLLLASAFIMNIFSLATGLLLGCILAAGAGIFKLHSLKESLALVPFLAIGLIAVSIL